jgi:putative membrane protein
VTTDAWLAILHHVAIFGLFAALVTELAIVRPGMSVSDVRRVSRVDVVYGVAAGVVLLAGLARVGYGAKPEAFYEDNPLFWAKLAVFVTVALLSIGPTLRYRRWRRAGAGAPAVAEVTRVRHVLAAQAGLFAGMPVLAALMARGIGL